MTTTTNQSKMLEDLEKMSGELVASDHYDADKVASSVFFSELSFDTKQVHKRPRDKGS